jgi:uncharacterized membrane protein YjgN (DUF898 family)
MNNAVARSAVRVIRLDSFDPEQPVTQPVRSVDELEPQWSSLPPVAWPDPIGSGSLGAPVAPDLVEGEGLDSLPGARVSTSAPSTGFDSAMGATTAGQVASAQDVASGKIPRLPDGVVISWPLRFHGEPGVYARLWLRNLLLILLTAGLYLPWARVRSQRYLMRHTQVAGHVLDYHEPPSQLLPRYALSLALMLGVAGAWAGGSSLAGRLALSLALAVWPLMVLMGLTHRMAHLSWAHRRLAFDGSCQQVYRGMWGPLFGGGFMAGLLLAAIIFRSPGNWVAWGGALALWVLAMPAFVWTWYLFRQRGLRLGPLQLLSRASKPEVRMMFLSTFVWAMLAPVFNLGASAMALVGVLVMRGQLSLTLERGLLLAGGLLVCAVVQPYAQARLQNLVWSKSGNRYLRFRSKLSVADFVMLQCKHAVLLVLTLGLYWPWAVMATRRMRTHSLTIRSRVDVDVLKAHWPVYDGAATSQMASARLRALKAASMSAL